MKAIWIVAAFVTGMSAASAAYAENANVPASSPYAAMADEYSAPANGSMRQAEGRAAYVDPLYRAPYPGRGYNYVAPQQGFDSAFPNARTIGNPPD
jgi:hypothetical protein